MTPYDDGTWAPSPELVAAYFDGEFEGRDDLAPLRQRLEDWLAANAEGRVQLGEYRHLHQVWSATTPADPGSAAWQKIQAHLEACLAQPRPLSPPAGRRSLRRAAALLSTAAAGVLLAALLVTNPAHAPEDDSPFPVASEREVVILHVEGADTGTLVVGELPLQGALVLAGPGDMTLTSVQPAKGDNMIPEVNVEGPGRPIIWARAESEDD
jgi:hypothetical protein